MKDEECYMSIENKALSLMQTICKIDITRKNNLRFCIGNLKCLTIVKANQMLYINSGNILKTKTKSSFE